MSAILTTLSRMATVLEKQRRALVAIYVLLLAPTVLQKLTQVK